MKKELRKYSNNLIVSGTGVMAFGIWSVVKSLMMAFLSADGLKSSLVAADPDSDLFVVIGYIVFATIIIVSLLVRGYIGLNARAIGNGKRTPKRFIVISVILLIVDIIAIIASFTGSWDVDGFSLMDKVATLAVDLTSIYSLVEMLISVRKVNEIRRLKGRP